MKPLKLPLAIIGVGNTLAGDDGAGVEVVRRLQRACAGETGVFLHIIEGDHFEMAELLDRAERFIFVDAVQGDRAGELVFAAETRRAFAPSFHQSDMSAVMHFLQASGVADPFPRWEVWGITIEPPSELGEGLTPEVDEAVTRLSEMLMGELRGV
jgi:hydrogenase maturation protease